MIHALRRYGSVSQTELARLTALSPSTVLRITRELLKERLVFENGKDRSIGGRRPVLLTFNSTAGYVIGVDLGGSHMVGAIADLSGKLLTVHSAATPARDGPEHVLSTLYDIIDRLLAATSIPIARVRAIGVGAPGVTQSTTGTVIHAPALGWRDVPLRTLLQNRFGAPALVENDANMIALGELWFGAAQGARNMVAIVIGTGIGAGVILNGELYRGSREAAGEVGFAVFDKRYLGIPHREFGCLESYAAGPGIAHRARERARAGEMRQVLLRAGSFDEIHAEQVFAAARGGDEDARALVAETSDALAIAIINVSAILDPDVVVLGGGVMKTGDLMIARIQAHLSQALVTPPKVVKSELADEATVKGAVARALAADPDHPLTMLGPKVYSDRMQRV